MEYSGEEISYVRYCVTDLPACEDRRQKCPVYDSCHDNGECRELCSSIVEKMTAGEILCEEDRRIVEFLTLARGLWESDESERACHGKGVAEPCPNLELCTEQEQREDEGHWVCSELLMRLDTKALRVKEREIQRAIVRLCPNDWKLGERVTLVDHERPIPGVSGRIDIILRGETTDDLYIVELKTRATREHVGQLAAYVGWCKKHPLPEQTNVVRGVMLAEEFDRGALAALDVCPDLMARHCQLRVDVNDVQQV